jgi:hypothetical protein
MKRIRVVAVGLIMSAGVLGSAVPVHADSPPAGQDNIVMVTNTAGGDLKARSRTTVSHNPGPTVSNQNYAEAYAHDCTGCRTVAAAVQVVVVEGSTTSFTPTNAALAINENCHSCQTFAYANQYVFSPLRPVELSDSAREQLAEVRDQIAEVVRSQKPFPQMSADLDSLSSQLISIVRAEIQRAGTSADEKPFREVQEQHT